MPTFTLATSRTVLNPVRAQEWNVSIRRGDDVRIALTVYDDDGGLPTDVTGAQARLYLRSDGYGERILWDYGRGWISNASVLDCGTDQIIRDGLVTVGLLGRIDFSLAAADTTTLHGRYRMLLQVVLFDGSTTQVEGILQMRAGGAVISPATLPLGVFGIGAFNPAIGGPGLGLFDNIGLLPDVIITPPIIVPPVGSQFILGQAILGQFKLG